MVSLRELRQSAAELVACAVIELFPGVVLVDSCVTEFGFHYDFIAEQPIDAYAIVLIEEQVRRLAKEGREVRALDMMRENAAMLFEHKGQSVKAQFVRQVRENIVSVLQIDQFYDYCPSPFIATTDEVSAIKILKVERVKRCLSHEEEVDVVRVRGTAFFEKDQLKKYVKSLQAAKKVDHRRLGEEMRLFRKEEKVSGAGWIWLSNGVNLREVLYDHWRDLHRRSRFCFLATPGCIKESLMKTSGLYDLFPEMESGGECDIQGDFHVPLCSVIPSHAMSYLAQSRSYRELPIRFAECANLHFSAHMEPLWGILNASWICSDHAHIFCAPEQLKVELISSLQFIVQFINMFGFEYHWHLCGRGQKFFGKAARWEKTQEVFCEAFEAAGISPLEGGDPSFIGPFAEVELIDSTGRKWKGPRIGLDFCTPERFGLRYQKEDGGIGTPVMVTRSLFGSFERFIAVLIEHFAGNFPVWLAPQQVRVIPVSEKNHAYAKIICEAIEERGYRTAIDDRDEHLGSKVHSAENERIPYVVIVGDKEEKQRLITVRSCGPEMAGVQMTTETFLTQLQQEVQSKSLPRKSKNAK